MVSVRWHLDFTLNRNHLYLYFSITKPRFPIDCIGHTVLYDLGTYLTYCFISAIVSSLSNSFTQNYIYGYTLRRHSGRNSST